jgi:hypothetical protein
MGHTGLSMSLFPDEEDDTAPNTVKPKKPRKPKKLNLVQKTYDSIQANSCCFDCGWKKITKLLEFHHTVVGNEKHKPYRRGKTKSPRKAKNLTEMHAELDKGEFLCRNCHGERHFNHDTGQIEWFNNNLR